MKELFLLISCIVLCTSISDAQDSVSISDFRYPETRVIDWKAGLSGNFRSNSSEYKSRWNSGPYNETINHTSGVMQINSNFIYFHTKDDHDQKLILDFYGGYNTSTREINEIEYSTNSYDRTNNETAWNYSANLDWTYQHYLTEEGMHLIGSVGARYYNSYYKNENIYHVLPADTLRTDYSKYYTVSFNGKLGLGFGRMRDGTVVYQALRVVERLREDGLVIKPLSRDETIDLVNRIMKRREYQINYERYDKYFIQDIVQELVDSGIVPKESVTPFSVVRMIETFHVESIQPRLFGWRVFYLFEDKHTQTGNEGTAFYLSPNTYNNDWVYEHLFGVEYGVPLSLKTHFFAMSTLELPTQDYSRKFNFDMSTSLSYELSEKIEVTGSYSFNRSVDNVMQGANASVDRSIYHRIQGNFVYFLEDQVRFTVNPAYSWNLDDYFPDPFSTTGYDMQKASGFSLSFGLNYNIY